MRIFSAPKPGHWGSVFADVGEALVVESPLGRGGLYARAAHSDASLPSLDSPRPTWRTAFSSPGWSGLRNLLADKAMTRGGM